MLRKDYMADMSRHSEYYRQFCTPAVIRTVRRELEDEIKTSVDPHFNDIPLKEWDKLNYCVSDTLFYQCGDHPSLAGKVCVLKEAAKLVKSGP